MRKIVFMTMFLISGIAFGQSKEVKEVKKEVRVENENGVKTVEIVTVSNGQETKEIYTGEEADAKLAELEAGVVEVKEEVRKEVKMEEVDGVKKLTIRTESNGKVEEEIYMGEEADKKLKELESANNAPKRMEVKTIKRMERSMD